MNTQFNFIFQAIAIAFMAFCAATGGQAAPGDLDPTFDTDGMVTTNFFSALDTANAVAIQSDGKIVAAGSARNGANNEFGVARYNTDGSLDTSFDTDGKVTTAVGTVSVADAVAIQTDGKIIVAGYAQTGAVTDFAIVRYNANGSLDTTFDTDGVVTTDFNTKVDRVFSLAIQSDDKIVAAGHTEAPTFDTDFAIARYNANGSLDTAFDTDGKVTTVFNAGKNERIHAVTLQTDGKIVAAGFSNTTSTRNDFSLARYNTNGSLDTTFDSDGKVTTVLSADRDDQIHGMALQPDGKIVAAGYIDAGPTATRNDFALARYNADGSIDTGFGSGGSTTADFFGTADRGHDVLLQPDGKIVVGGFADNAAGDNKDFALARYKANGSPDTGFGTGGKVTTEFGGPFEQLNGVILQTDGKIVAAGGTFGADGDFALSRYSLVQPDNIIGKSGNPAAGRGNDIYNLTGAGQTLPLTSRRAKTVRATLNIQNDGATADTFTLRGTKGNTLFRAVYTSAAGNVTGAVTAGTYPTPALNPGETHPVTITVKPNKSRLLKKVRKGKRRVTKSLKKRRTFVLASTSQGDTTKKDVAKVKVLHK